MGRPRNDGEACTIFLESTESNKFILNASHKILRVQAFYNHFVCKQRFIYLGTVHRFESELLGIFTV